MGFCGCINRSEYALNRSEYALNQKKTTELVRKHVELDKKCTESAKEDTEPAEKCWTGRKRAEPVTNTKIKNKNKNNLRRSLSRIVNSHKSRTKQGSSSPPTHRKLAGNDRTSPETTRSRQRHQLQPPYTLEHIICHRSTKNHR